ncbi:DUF6475 domain-containing protein [Colwellia sp. MEBiC06753]
MLNSEQSAFFSTLLPVFEIYKMEASKPVVKLWWQLLEKFSLADVQQAFLAFMSDGHQGSYMLTPAAIIGKISAQQAPEVEAAWQSVCAAMRHSARGQAIRFEDETIHHVIKAMGGWRVIRECTADKLIFQQREFSSKYLQLVCQDNGPVPQIGGNSSFYGEPLIIKHQAAKSLSPVSTENTTFNTMLEVGK